MSNGGAACAGRTAIVSRMQSPPSTGPWPDTLVAVLLGGLRTGESPRVLGISGLQGTGKSTLATQLVDGAHARGLRSAVLSLDDLYLDHDVRAALAHDVHPLLATRGPPGTHDVALGLSVFDAVRKGASVCLPRFDKLGDCRLSEDAWPQVEALNLLVFEGWCVGATAEDPATLDAPINALERDEDPDGTWRRWCNTALARDYPPLWAAIDTLLFLQPPGFEIVPTWRWQQEQTLQAAAPGRRGMSRAQIERFVQHYERVSRQALKVLPDVADMIVRLDAERNIISTA